MLRRKRFWIGLAISALFLAFFLAQTDFGDIRDAFARADLLLACAVAPLYFVGFWLRTVRWRFLLRPVSDVSTVRLYPVVLVGLMANNVAPARIGELVRAYLLGERERMSKSTALGTIAVDRAFDGLTLVAILGIALVLSGADAGVKSIGIGAAVVFVAAASVLTALALMPDRARAWLSALINLAPRPFAERISSLLDQFILGLVAIRRPSALLGAAAFSVASWMVEGGMYYVIGRAFHLDVGFEVYLIILAGANLALSVVATPGGVGPFEATTILILSHFGVVEGLREAYALALHALLLGPVIVVGFVIVAVTQVSLRDVFGSEAAPAPVPPHPSVATIPEAK